MKPLDDVQFIAIFILAITALSILFSACSAPKPAENHGWQETGSPRPDLQCWVQWSDPKTTVCAPSLTSTRGASQ